jgi:UDP-glucose 4-epimerase
VKRRLGDARYISADSSRLRAELSWLPQIDSGHGVIELPSL